MSNDDERSLGGGLGAAIFVMPQIFGWLVFRKGYHPLVRVVVAIYMILSTIPLYFLISILWNSGEDVQRLARDYESNRAAAEKSSGTARDYIEQYEDGNLRSSADVTRPPVEKQESRQQDEAIRLSARDFAVRLERDASMISALQGKSIEISGTSVETTADGRVYLVGGGSHPAIILEFDGAPPTSERVTATCISARMESGGPTLGGCR